MKRRPKEETRLWKRDIAQLFKTQPKAQLTENRYKAVYAVLRSNLSWIKEIPQEKFITMLDLASWLEREMRRQTEDRQEEIKTRLSQEKVVELYK